MKRKTKTKPVIFIYLVIAIVLISYIIGVFPFNLFLSLIVYSSLYLVVVKERKTVKILTDLVILNFLIAYDNLLELIKRKLMPISRSLLFLKILVFLDYKLPKFVYSILLFISVKLPRKIRRAVKLILKIIVYLVIDLLDLAISFVSRLYKKTYTIVYSVLLFLSVKLPRKIRRAVKLILKIIVYSTISLLDLVYSLIIVLLNSFNKFISELRLIINKLTIIYLSKRAALTRFAGIVVFVLIILFFFVGVKPGEETIKFVGAVGEACVYETDCALCENCVSSVCTYVANGLADTLGTFLCTGTTGCSATTNDYCRCNGAGTCLTNDAGECTANAQCFNYCDAENTANEGLQGLESDDLVCFSGIACDGGAVKCGNQDGDCQYDPGSDPTCDDYSEGSTVGTTGYCDSNCGYHAIGIDKFYVKNSAGSNIASFDDAGNVVITGTLTQSSATAPSGGDDFIIQDSAGTWQAWIDGATGNMYLAGTMLDGQAISPPANSFIIQNSAGTAVSYIDSSGNLRLSGAFVAGGTP